MTIIDLLIVSLLALLVWPKKKRKKIKNIIKDLPGNPYAWAKRDIKNVTDITLHHAASSNNATAFDFAKHHIQNKGWVGIGYHFVIDRSGNIFQTNFVDRTSFHNGYNNSKAIGICMVGNMDLEPVSNLQLSSVLWLVNKLKRENKNIKNLVGHGEYIKGRTACPGKMTPIEYLRKKTGLNPHGKPVSNFLLRQRYNSTEADN